MNAMLKKLIFSLFFIAIAVGSYAQDTRSLWKETTVLPPENERVIKPSKFKAYTVDFEQLKQAFLAAPMEDLTNKSNGIIVWLPMPDGNFERFRVYEYSMMEPGLAAKFPNIKNYIGEGIDDQSAGARISITPHGFNAMIMSGVNSTVFIDPYLRWQDSIYQVYNRNDYTSSVAKEFKCTTNDSSKLNKVIPKSNNGSDCMLRSYRLALSCTGEYTGYQMPFDFEWTHIDSVYYAIEALNNTINRINEVYYREFGVRLTLINDNDKLIFTDPDMDPYSSPWINPDWTDFVIDENINYLNFTINPGNYDIGHVLAYSDTTEGVAYVGVVCDDEYKAGGISSSNQPIGDLFYIDEIAHEIGHQFGARHTQNNDCSRNMSTAFEPGSGSTIMGYAGICPPDVQDFSDDYFHAISLEQITDFILFSNGSNCAEVLNGLGSTSADAGFDYAIPKLTPFKLNGSGNGTTYCWEQMDLEQFSTEPPSSFDTYGPQFRSYPPNIYPYRYIPSLESLINGTVNFSFEGWEWERLSSVEREYNFRLTARNGNGCIAWDDMNIEVAPVGPFYITQPNSDVLWSAGTKELVKWEVASTNTSPVNCLFVDILLSIDGGVTFEKTLASNVPNTGEYELNVPDFPTQAARLMVKAADNIFFDINDETFEICSMHTEIVENEDPTCHGECDGATTLFVSGGVQPYSFNWNINAPTINSILGYTHIYELCKGKYYVTITDGNPKKDVNNNPGCKIQDTIEIKEPEEFKVFIKSPNNVLPFGPTIYASPCNPVQLVAVLKGGTEPYYISWDAYTKEVHSEGFYALTAEDANECGGAITVYTQVIFLDVNCDPNNPSSYNPYDPNNPDAPPDDPNVPYEPIFIRFNLSSDPNEISGPKGYSDAQWVAKQDTLHFTIHYENNPEFATAPAQIVSVRQPVDPRLDLFSFRLGDFGFGNFNFKVPPNSLYYANRLDLRDSLGLYVDVTAGIDVTKRELFWRLESIDPLTGLAPADPQAGFLPVNDSLTQSGMGYVQYSIKAASNLVTGDSLQAKAEIVFDINAPIATNTWHNLVDAVAPQSHVNVLPVTSDTTRFMLSWSGQDDPGGVGIARYDLYVSKNGEAFSPLLQGIDTTTFEFWGQAGNTYAFHTRATDHVGNKEPVKTQAEATIYVEDALTEGLDIALSQGWNMISSYVRPSVPNMLSVLNPLSNEVIILKDGEGKVAVPFFGINSIGDWAITEGYQLKSLVDTVLTIRGIKVSPSETPVAIQPGWQIIAYLRDRPGSIETALAGIADKIVLVKNNEGKTFIPSFGINNIGDLIPTQGYQLKALEDAILVYAANDSLKQLQVVEFKSGQPGFDTVRSSQQFVREYPITGNNATIVLPKTVGDAVMHTGEEIGVFSEDGLMCGAAVYEGSNLAITVWGDDPKTTYQKEGLINGEPYLLKKWDPITGKSELLSFDFQEGVPLYSENGYAILSNLEQAVSSLDDPAHLMLFNFYPQPAGQKVHFQLALSEPSKCRLDLLNIEGKYQTNILEGTYSLHNFDFDVSRYSSGMYLLRLTIDSQTKLYRLAVLGQ